MRKTILGIFPKHTDADSALFHLKEEGIDASEVSVIAREESVKRYRSRGDGGRGAVTGGLLGGLAGLLIATTPVVLPGVGILIAGPLTILASFATGALAGGVLGALIDIGVSERAARSYERRIERGEVLLAVNADDQIENKVKQILKDHNAEEITEISSEQSRLIGQETPSVAYASRVTRPKKR